MAMLFGSVTEEQEKWGARVRDENAAALAAQKL
jgi:hypothetical protein